MTTPTILIIDDQPDNLAVFAAVVGEHLPEATILCAGSADEGFAVIAQHPPDVILLDVQMPGTSGIKMCQMLKAAPATAHIPVILITAQRTEGPDRARGLNVGAEDFLNKPVDNEELVARIRVALRIKQAEDRLRQSSQTQRIRAELSEAQSKTVLESISDAFFALDDQLVVTYFNAAAERVLNRKSGEVLGRPLFDAFPEAQGSVFEEKYREALREKKPLTFEVNFAVPPYTNWYDVRVYPQEKGLSIYFQVVTEQKRVEREREATIEILRLINNKKNHTHDLIQAVTRYLQEWSGCQAVGIRLKDGDDYPYFETRGFPAEFVALENRLCARDPQGQCLRDTQGNPVLECMCGNIIQGRFDPTKPFFTKRGSFWSNCTTKLLASTTEADRQARTRNRCNREGYESVALIPLRFGSETLGLIQLNDRRRDRFTPEFIETLERMASSLAVALSQRKAEGALRESEIMYRTVADFTYDWEFWRGPDGRLRYCSPSCERITGYSADEFLADPDLMLRIVHPDERDSMKEHLAHAESSQAGVLKIEFRIVTREGQTRWIGHICAPVTLPGGLFLGRRASNRDITERKRAEEAQRRSEERVRESLDNLLEGCQIIGFDWRYLYLNDAAARQGRRPKEYFLGRTMMDALPGVEGTEMFAVLKRCMERREPQFMVNEFTYFDGAKGWFELRLQPISEGIFILSIDITERKRAEQALRQSEERYQRLTHAVTDYIYTVTLGEGGSVETVHGHGCEAVTGYRSEEFAASPYLWIEMVDPQDRALVKDLARRLLAGEDVGPYEHRIIRRDGTLRWVRNTPSLRKDPAGKLLSYDGLISDITERKQAEIALRESEARFRQVLDATPFPTAVADTQDDKIHYWSRSALELFGHTPPTTSEWYQLAYPDPDYRREVIARWKPFLQTARQSGRAVNTGEYRVTCKDDSVRICELHAQFIAQYLIVTFNDITERQRAEEARQKSAEELRTFFALAPSLVCIASANGHFKVLNDAWEKTLGFTREELCARPFAEFIHPEDREPTLKEVEKQLGGHSTLNFVNRYRCKDGSYRWLQWQAVPASGDRLFAIAQDVSERKIAERRAQLRADVLSLLNGPSLDPDGMRQLLELIRTHSGVEVAALRLRKGDDFPYVYSLGLSGEFIRSESALCTFDAAGEAVRDRSDRVALACLCGAVLRGELPQAACFSRHGSFRSGDLKALVDARPAWLTCLHPRGKCLQEGFRSMALIPIRAGGETVGLLQLSQCKLDGFGADEVEFLEELSESIGVAIARHEAESALRISEERYRALVSDSPVAILVQTAEGIQYANPAALKLLLLDSPMDLVGHSLAELMHPDELGMVSDRLNQALVERKSTPTTTHRLLLKDGTVAYVDSQAIPMLFGGRPAVQVMATDITSRRQAETAQLLSEERFRRMFESSPLGVALSSGNSERFLRVNQRFCQITGYSSKELESMTVAQLTHPDDRALDLRRARTLQKGDEPVHTFEKRYIRKDRTTVWVRVSASLMRDEKGQPTLHLAMVEDISERRLLEEQLRQAQKMESLGQLAGGIAHDFNNQLAVIVGYAELIEGNAESPALKAHARQALNAATKSSELTKQLLAFARRGQYEAKVFDVRTIITETITVLRRTLNKKIEVRSSFDQGLALVLGDAALLGNALFNLAINARDAMPDGGTLHFFTEHVRLAPEEIQALGEDLTPGPYLRIRVQDTGQGMTPEVRLRIFEPFFTTKGEGKGTGLGLAAVYGTVKRHHGAILVESEIGLGTTFTIYLPLAVVEEQTAPVVAAPLPDLSGLRILSIDDEESVAKMLHDILQSVGCQVTARHDGVAATEYFKKHWRTVDLVILDMNMPKMDGVDTMRALRRVDAKVKVLIATGQSAEGELRAVQELGAMGVVAKPFLRDQLLREIGRVIGRT